MLDGIQVAGFIDFYYACNGSFMYDLAIAVNDWARLADNRIDPQLQQAFMRGYQSVRPLTPAEQAYLPIAHRAGCIRFWVSRLLDYHFPQGGEMTFVKDPDVFRDLLLYFRQSPAPAATDQAPFNLEGKVFQPAEAGHAGKTPERCRFRQDDDTVWAEYQGGGIRKGFLLGCYTEHSSIVYTRQHLTLAGAAHSSSGCLRIETLPDSRLRLHLFGEDGEAVWEECAP